MNIKKISKQISIALFIALLPNLFFAACTGEANSNVEKIESVSDTSNTADTSEIAENPNDTVSEPAISKFTYEGDFSSAFPNPERGFYKRADVTRNYNFDYVNNLDITIVHSYVPIYTYLDMTKENPWGDNTPEKLPDILLENLQTGLDAIRGAGLKVILRPAYAWDWIPPVVEHWDIVKSHIAQINAIISKNADVVMGLEAGILGPWGEWHSDGIYTDSNSQEGADLRYELFKYILDTTPDNIPVRIRYPYFIKEMLYLGVNPPGNQSAMTQAQLDRISYHDDSFMADENDWGSYNPRSVWWGKLNGLKSNNVSNAAQRQWVYDLRTSFGGNVLMGGEMEWDGNKTIKHENSVPPLRVLKEMADLHTTDISTDYNPEHINLWKDTDIPASDIGEPAETVYDRIGRRLGYRLRLVEAEFTTANKSGGEFIINVSLINDGFAGIIKERPLYIVFENETKRIEFPLDNIDVRLWLSGENKLTASFNLPDDMPKGVYVVALWLPDAAENLRSRPEYSVRFANKNVWDGKKGYNKLGEIIIF